MNKKLNPYIIGLPNLAIGLLWAMNLIVIPLLIGTTLSLEDPNYNKKIGILISMGAFTGIFVQYIVGILSDRSNFKMGKRKPFIIIGTLGSIFTILLAPFVKEYKVMFVILTMFYIFLNVFQGAYYALIPEVVERNKIGLSNGFARVIGIIGSALIFLFGASLWGINRYYLFILGAIISLVFVGTLLFIKEKKIVLSPSRFRVDFYKYKAIMKLFSLVFIVFFSYGCITPFLVRYSVTKLNFTENEANIALLVLTICGAIFAYPIGVLTDKISKKKVFGLGTLIFSIGLVGLIFFKDKNTVYVLLGFMGIGFMAIQIAIYTICAVVAVPERMGEFMGIMNIFISLGQFSSNNLMGFVLDKYGYGIFFVVPAIFMILSTVFIFITKFEREF